MCVCRVSVAANCQPGYGVNSSGECVVCGPGKYGVGGDNPCQKCPAGTWSSQSGVSTCRNTCAAGKYSLVVGATSSAVCKDCPTGHCCAYGHKYTCLKGTYGDGGTACRGVLSYQQNVVSGGVCMRSGTCPVASVYQKGVCIACNPGCTTPGLGSISNEDCTVKTAKKFCVGNSCFSWPNDGSVSEQPLNSVIENNNTCPGTTTVH